MRRGRPRTSITNLPPYMHEQAGRFYFKAPSRAVRDAIGAWSVPLGDDREAAQRAWAALVNDNQFRDRLRLDDSAKRTACRARVGFVYAMQRGDGGPIKIGFVNRADSIQTRRKGLQTASAERIRVIGFAPGSMALEALAHEAFGKLRLNGEWFAPHPDVTAFANTLASQGLDGAFSTFPNSSRIWGEFCRERGIFLKMQAAHDDRMITASNT